MVWVSIFRLPPRSGGLPGAPSEAHGRRLVPRRAARALLLLALLLAAPAGAHQPTETLLRQVRIERGWVRTHVAVVLPATLLWAQAAAARPHPGAPVEAPGLVAVRQGAGWSYRVDTAAPEALAPLIGRAVAVRVGGRAATLADVVLRHARPPGADGPPPDLAEAHVSEILVEARFRAFGGGTVALDFAVDAVPLPPFVHLETAVEDARAGATLRRIGPLDATLELPPS